MKFVRMEPLYYGISNYFYANAHSRCLGPKIVFLVPKVLYIHYLTSVTVGS